MNQLARKTASGAAINIFVTVSKTVIQFAIVLPILARLVPPAEFGLVGMAMAFVGFFTMFNDLGISAALVRADKPSDAFWSTAFITNLILGVSLTILAFLAAPYIAAFFNEALVEPLIKALSVILVLHCIFLVPMAWLQRNFRFKHIAIIDLVATVLAAVTAIWAAFEGYGVWALVWQQIVMFGIKMIGGLVAQRAPLKLKYNWSEIVAVLPFSLQLTGTGLVAFVNRNTDNVLIGRFLGAEALGFYGRAYQMMLMPVHTLSLGASFALYPAMSELKAETKRLGKLYMKSASVLGAITIPMMTGLAIVSVPFVDFVFGENWGPVAPVLRLLAFVGIIQSVLATANVVWKALGRSDVLLRWSLIRMAAFVLAFAIGINFGTLEALSLAYLIANIILFLPFQVSALHIVDLKLKDFIAALGPQIVSTVIMAAVLLSVMNSFPKLSLQPSYVQLGLLVGIGMIAYAMAMLVFFRTFVTDLLNEARALFFNRKHSAA